MLPTSAAQLLVIVLAVIPGFVYQITQRRLRGPRPDELDAGVRVLRAIAFSALFVTTYVLVLGRDLVDTITEAVQLASDPRPAAAAALTLTLAVPVASAGLTYVLGSAKWWARATSWIRDRLHLRRSYDPTPTAWDFAFQAREPGWVRILTTDGAWIGGWFGVDSYASSFPQPRDVFIESAYAMKPDGAFTDTISAASGTYVRCDDVRLIEFLPDIAARGDGTDDAST